MQNFFITIVYLYEIKNEVVAKGFPVKKKRFGGVFDLIITMGRMSTIFDVKWKHRVFFICT